MTASLDTIDATTYEHALDFLDAARVPRLRTRREFAEQEIMIPNGPHPNLLYKVRYQPYAGLYLDAVDSGLWTIIVALGPSQSGKTLTCFVIMVLYHVFELKEDVIIGLPDADMANVKWKKDFKRVIDASSCADLLPTKGEGSRGGTVKDMITFQNGVSINFMTGGAGDKGRAGDTTRVLSTTESNVFDTISATSEEADQMKQLKARLRAFDLRTQEYHECTTSTKEGFIWREYKAGTASRIVLKCPRCKNWVTSEREHFIYNKDAENEIDAMKGAAFGCPSCGAGWTEKQRHAINQKCKLVHRGQKIDRKGKITGPLPKTNTLGFRWSAVNNLFSSAGLVARDEWNAAHAEDEDNAEKEMCQFVWAVPYEAPVTDMTPLDPKKLERRMDKFSKGLIPGDTEQLALGIDVGKHYLDWVLEGWRKGNMGNTIDYGRRDVPSHDMTEELAIMTALRDFKMQIDEGWAVAGTDKARRPGEVWIDCGYKSDVIDQFVIEANRDFKEMGIRWRSCMGFGTAKRFGQSGSYNHPKSIGQKKKSKAGVLGIGEQYHIVRITTTTKRRVDRVNISADHWKTWLWTRLKTAQGEPGSISFFETKEPHYHKPYIVSLTSERCVETFKTGQGPVLTWEVRQKNKNHWLDASYLACGALHKLGARLMKEKKPPQSTGGYAVGGDKKKSEKWKVGR